MIGGINRPASRLAGDVSPPARRRGHPIATTEFPKAESVEETAHQTWAALRHVRLKRRLPAAVHAPKDGYRCAGMPPSSSEISMANGQSSTDSFGAAPSIIEGAGFRPARVNGRVTVDQQRRAWLLLTGAKPAARHRVEDPANYSNRGGNPFPPLGTARLSQAASPPHASHHTLRNRPEETE